MTVKIIQGDALEVLRTLSDESVHCCVTSPPYWGLRDYGTAKWVGGDPDHKHDRILARNGRGGSGSPGKQTDGAYPSDFPAEVCSCGARRIDSQLGLERTPEEYVAKMVEVFREVRRVLRSDGTLWLNLGDSYHGSGKASGRCWEDGKIPNMSQKQGTNYGSLIEKMKVPNGCKPKDLCGIPWRVAFALQADGWTLRQEIIWSKPNPMPESVRDRCTKSHEQIFLFSKAKWIGTEKGRFEYISEEDARWLALCIDTEGCIVVKRAKQPDGGADAFAPQVSFGSTSYDLMQRFIEIVGHGNLAERPGKNAKMFYWQVANKIASDFLYRIYNYLIVKKRQARIALYVNDLVYYRGGKFPERKQRSVSENNQLITMWSRCKSCNRFGDPDISDVPEPKFGHWDSQRYYYDAEAIKEPDSGQQHARSVFDGAPSLEPSGGIKTPHKGLWGTPDKNGQGRNKRSVWVCPTAPFPGAHFATFPPKLIEPCILAGCPAGGKRCDCDEIIFSPIGNGEIQDPTMQTGRAGMNRPRRENEGTRQITRREQRHEAAEMKSSPYRKEMEIECGDAFAHYIRTDNSGARPLPEVIRKDFIERGWITEAPPCDHPIEPAGVVLDPFGGSGTVGMVAEQNGRNSILIELNPKYVDMAKRRTAQQGLFAGVAN